MPAREERRLVRRALARLVRWLRARELVRQQRWAEWWAAARGEDV